MSGLVAENLTVAYGETVICHGCSLAVDAGEISVIVGPNGAGKSTAMKAIFGLVELIRGRVMLGDRDISRMAAQDRVALGMAFVPQVNNIFPSLTVEENLEMGAYRNPAGFTEALGVTYDMFPALSELRSTLAGNLSGGQRQQVAVGRAMMTRPRFLLLDEPTAGVSPIVMDTLFAMIVEIARTGVAILLCEQNARRALEIANRGYVLVQGRNRYEDTGKRLLANPDVRKSFLGG
ncbi:MAG: ABC transporter ATP-binding protein [Rhodobacteraceae bacterium]|nr:ABC transporter ATP-binding protein [Paracoccaceae bacterium]